jgi:hypothetical protein
MLPATAQITTRLFLAAVLSSMVAFPFCGDDDEKEASTPSPTRNARIDASIEGQFRDLAGRWAEATPRITYTLVNAAGEAEVTYYHRGVNRRIDHTLHGRTTIIIVRDVDGFSCLSDVNTCAQINREAALAASEIVPFLGPLATTDGLDAIVRGAESMEVTDKREIAGIEATCIKATGDLGGISGPTTFCFSEDGLLLFTGYEGPVPLEMTATKVDQSEDSDYDPPYAVASLAPTATASP